MAYQDIENNYRHAIPVIVNMITGVPYKEVTLDKLVEEGVPGAYEVLHARRSDRRASGLQKMSEWIGNLIADPLTRTQFQKKIIKKVRSRPFLSKKDRDWLDQWDSDRAF